VQEQLKAITPTSLNPEELTLLDPACGSGHILVEAYDLFKAIYQERGYRAKDIPLMGKMNARLEHLLGPPDQKGQGGEIAAASSVTVKRKLEKERDTVKKQIAELQEFDAKLRHPGTHKPLVDRVTFDKVQVLLGEKVYRSHELTYAGGLIQCKHCNAIVTGESVVKKTTGKEYVYYRCSQYNAPGHPRVRLNEEKLDRQILAVFDRMRIEDEVQRDWVASQIRRNTVLDQATSKERRAELNRQITLVLQQKDQLVNMRLNGEIEADTYAAKATELRDRVAMLKLKLKLDACDLGRDENGEIAIKAFELSQSLRAKWHTADYAEKHRVLEIVFLKFVLDDVTLVPTTRKPFDMVAEGLLVSSSRAGGI
jgi:hypothetical protein